MIETWIFLNRKVLLTGAFILITSLISACTSMGCGESFLWERPSPSGDSKIYLFEQGCGATTPNDYYYFVLEKAKAEALLPKKISDFPKKSLFFHHTRGNAQVNWESNNEIYVQYTPNLNRDFNLRKFRPKVNDIYISLKYLSLTSKPYKHPQDVCFGNECKTKG